jgi:hypothetical protein
MRESEDCSTTCTWNGVSSNDPRRRRDSRRDDRTRIRATRADRDGAVPGRTPRRDLHIDHGLRDDSGYGGRSHVIDAQRRRAERTSDVRGRPLVGIGPVRIMRHKFDRHVSTLRRGHPRLSEWSGTSPEADDIHRDLGPNKKDSKKDSPRIFRGLPAALFPVRRSHA